MIPVHGAEKVYNAGLGQLSRLKDLQRFSVSASFRLCTDNGLVAALATMTGTCCTWCTHLHT
jgi:hypothetical protein